MNRFLPAFGLVALFATAPLAGEAKKPPQTFTGRVEHISANNIKVYSPTEHRSLGFLLVPKFKQVFSSDGKTTTQMAEIHPGTMVRVYYDQHLLGARHADRIIVIGPAPKKVDIKS